ncbi:MAG: UvrD-helicase domain-containing protein [Bacilli bacterium]|nr:UvrD-helicase domain-containing protein [Bacilli bacterium]
MDYRSLLNEKQYEAVSTSSQYVRVVAGAGSGKTRVLTYRIAYLISEMGVRPNQILAITFTNKAAGEMADRAAKLVDEVLGYTPRLNISTFHAFCSRFLRMEAGAINFPTSFTIYDEDDRGKLLKNIGVELGYKKGDSFIKEASQYIGRNKTKGLYPEDITIKYERFPNEKKCLEFYKLYEQRKNDMLAMDFDDLMLRTIQILEGSDDIRRKWAGKFDHVLVDEFQDTNDVQYKLMKLLMRVDTCLYVVGDPDQTIYTWRGANQDIMLGLERAHENVETIVLNENYRSTKKILDAANHLIAHNKKRIPKDLFTSASDGDPILSSCQPKGEDEATWVASKIAQISRENRNEYGEPIFNNIVVLYRASYLTRPFESAFKDRQIPYKIYGGVRFYERMEVKDLLAYFNLMLNPKDNIAFERIINVPRRNIGDTSVDRIREEANQAGLSEYEYLCRIGEYMEVTNIPTRVIKKAAEFIAIVEDTKIKLAEKLEVYSEVLKKFVDEIGYMDYLREDEDPDEDRIKNVNALFDDINNFIDKNPNAEFQEYLQNVALLSSQDDISGGNFVSLMTIHIAKGLEFDNVFIIGMNQDVFPSMRSLDDNGRDGAEEERRLAYVAITRARKRLFCSCNESYSYITDSKQTPSQFFKEAEISLPRTSYYSTSSVWRSSGYGNQSSYGGSKPRPGSSYFGDGNAPDPFEKPKPKPAPVTTATNGITDWKVGDMVEHGKFGKGKVIEIISDKIIRINFDNEGIKTLLGSHPMLNRIKSEGGDA